ncbi:MAG TPA: dihydroorotase [Aquificales bacterium]|nr:dihydroorotase [Aquificales bacterium]
MGKLLIRGGYVVDPSQNFEGIADILVENGKISKIERNISPTGEEEIIDARYMVVAPAFVDPHAHLRDPGFTHKEDIESGSRAAVFGGFTAVVSMPNTNPETDNPALIEYQRLKAERVGLIRLYPAGAITRGRKGKELTEFGALKEAGAIALTDDGTTPTDEALLRTAFEWAADLDLLIEDHAELPSLSAGHINEGKISDLLGIAGRNRSAEAIAVARDGYLAQITGAKVHIQHITAKETVELLKLFKEKGVRITGEVNPNHLLLTEEDVLKYGSLVKVNPPLRTEGDRKALIEALAEGVIDCIGTDHAPHAPWEKDKPLDQAPPGMLGFQVALPALVRLYNEGYITLKRLVEVLSTSPAKILGLYPELGTLKVGTPADIVIFDLKHEWVFTEDINPSKSKNSPFLNQKLVGKVFYTIKGGEVVYRYGG